MVLGSWGMSEVIVSLDFSSQPSISVIFIGFQLISQFDQAWSECVSSEGLWGDWSCFGDKKHFLMNGFGAEKIRKFHIYRTAHILTGFGSPSTVNPWKSGFRGVHQDGADDSRIMTSHLSEKLFNISTHNKKISGVPRCHVESRNLGFINQKIDFRPNLTDSARTELMTAGLWPPIYQKNFLT